MSDQLNDIIARLRAEVIADSSEYPHVNVPLEDLRLIVQSFEILHAEKEALRRRVEQHAEVVEAVEVFIAAYRDKYKNYGNGGVRPSAVLRREVRMIWAAMNGHVLATDSTF
ncbi:hypothetical protein [Neorhizobium tomejilense]|uniref:hypothetical protein n=1 Tax=Neorhizobium tomejilense TaxID=2093828 RepID=UPI000CF99A96|nr:hypothetical protein [Neorhizobium tomejilense]